MIDEKKFSDYFFILADLVSYSKTKMVVGPARGSSCGSLVCYLLDITSIDPIPFGLIFERFIDVNRADLPDVDIDFSDVRRDEAFKYMMKLYGEEHVARLGTVNTYQPKSAMNTAAIALRVPQDAVDDVANVIIKRSQGDNRASSTLEDTLAETDAGRRLLARYPEMVIAGRMEEHPASAGRHAAGVVVTKTPVRDYVAVDSRTNATMCDKHDAEVLNLLKIDALGLTQLSIFERVAELLNGGPIGDDDYRRVNDWLGAIPLDDPKAFAVLNERHFAGIFQFSSGSALAHFVEDMTALKPNPIDSIEDMIALTALIRPGPLSSGGASEWMHRRVGRNPVSYPHPLLEPYLRDSLGIVIYQEQILRIGRELGDLSWADVTALRQAMSKSLGKEYFDQFGDRWKAGAIAHGLPSDVADRFWMDMVGFGAWAFNRAHSVAYGLVSYWSCYLKAKHPIEYAAATLDAESAKPESQIVVLRELEKEGVGYIPVDSERSGRKWEIVGKKLVGPLINIESVGPVAVERILQARASKAPIGGALEKRLLNPVTKIDSLYPIRDAVARVDLKALNIYSPDVPIASITSSTTERVLVFGVLFRVAQKDENTMVAVQRRGGRVLDGPTTSLQLFLRDDSGDIFAKVGRYDFDRIGRRVLEHGRIGKAIWAVVGTVPFGIGMRMIMVENVRIIGDLDDAPPPILVAAE